MKKEDEISQLIDLLKQASQERDEAKSQLQILLNKLQRPSSIDLHPAASFLQPESPQLRQQAWGSSSITESENLSDNQNHHSHVSSPAVVDSFLDVASAASPELSNMNRADSGNILVAQQALMNASTPTINKNGDMNFYDKLTKKPLPEKGQLLEAVIGAGPLLETLFVAGSLPQWKNPPPLRPLLIPPMINASVNNTHFLQSCNGGLQSSVPSPMISYGSASFFEAKMPLIQHSAGSQHFLKC
ncbi:hypothetical protein AXF42_Ash008710 [Apostasia shenzhenica]|uniref:Uncharacterized protein n=1 Tax=Apostasia shenzhenica TaxID=1088818 RepID=A0A2I0B260_9ASPA|nr:hypothetical protein AXF42_Ash008710 [Apostasia shenzhenica]